MSEDRERGGGIFSIWLIWPTWRRAAFHPGTLYDREHGGPRTHPLVFAVVVGTLAAVVEGLADGGLGRAVLLALLYPPLVVVQVYVSAALIHFWLVVLRGRGGRYRDTAAAVGYAYAPVILGVVPLLGAGVAYVWQLVVLALGLRHAQRTAPWKAWLAVLLGVGTPALVALGLRAGVVEAFEIPRGAMIPTLLIGDRLLVEKLSYGPLLPGPLARLHERLPPTRGDVMVFRFPENEEQDFIKRAIALPGDTLEAVNGRPVINGWLVPHCRVGPYHPLKGEPLMNREAQLYVELLGDRDYLTLFEIDPDAQRCSGAACESAGMGCRGGICGVLEGPFRVAPREVWVMGDNRDHSFDSRIWRRGAGAGVPFEDIEGRATFVWTSLDQGGDIRFDRIGAPANGEPTLPPGQRDLQPALDACLRARPPVRQTTPPAPR